MTGSGMTVRSGNVSGRRWSSRLAFILAAIGSAVGLGNYWRFPYVVGEHGGGTFILAYLLSVFLVGLPLMVFEVLVGRRFRGSVRQVLSRFGHERWAVLPVVITLFVLSFYSVLVGWTLTYSVFSVLGATGNEIPYFQDYVNGYWGIVGFLTVVSITFSVVYLGVGGIERFVKPGVLIMVVITLFLLIYASRLPGFSEGLGFLFTPIDPSKLLNLHLWLNVLSQTTFSLSVGFGVIMTYSAYSRGSNILTDSLWIVLGDLLIAVLASMIIFSIVFTYHLTPDEGPTLMFTTLPHVFNRITFGWLIGLGFYLTLMLAGITSCISMMEYLNNNLSGFLGLDRKKTTIIIFLLVLLLGLPVALSYTPVNLQVAGERLLVWYDRLFVVLPVPVILLITLSIGWLWDVDGFTRTVDRYTHLGRRWSRRLVLWIRYVIPVVVLVLLYQSITTLLGWLF